MHTSELVAKSVQTFRYSANSNEIPNIINTAETECEKEQDELAVSCLENGSLNCQKIEKLAWIFPSWRWGLKS